MKFESPSLVQKLWPRINILQKELKGQGQGHKTKNFGTRRKVLSEEIYMCNMKGLPLMVQKVWPKLKFLKSSSKVKVTGHRVQIFGSN